VVSKEHTAAARKLRALIATYEAKRDLIAMGAYAKGSDKELDEAILRMPRIEAFLSQDAKSAVALEDTVAALALAVK
jgi:flagellar biosynthesis/type III secretory pathway ATPase